MNKQVKHATKKQTNTFNDYTKHPQICMQYIPIPNYHNYPLDQDPMSSDVSRARVGMFVWWFVESIRGHKGLN